MTFDPGPLAAVRQEGASTLVFVRELRHPPATVWAALTDPARITQWAPFDADRDLGTPGTATLTMVDGDTRLDMPVTVHRAEPPTLLEYTWGTDLLRWDLEATDTGTRLTLRHTAEKPDWLPKLAAGWHICLAVAERLLDGDPVGVIRGKDGLQYGWEELRDGYTERLG
jgi:uncharacterized protein YndB with AHSA1/START domain